MPASLSYLTIEERIMQRRAITDKECWVWTGSCNPQGYGQVRIDYKLFGVHRLSASIYLDFDLNSDQDVLHKCDNPPCFNPDHLFVGSHKDNMQDAIKKKRFGPMQRQGDDRWSTKIYSIEYNEIKKLHDQGMSMRAIARSYNVHHKTIMNILRKIS